MIFRLTIKLIVRDIRYMFIAGSRFLRLLFSWPFWAFRQGTRKDSREVLRVPIMELIKPEVLQRLVEAYGLRLDDNLSPKKDKPGSKGAEYSFKDYEKLMRHDSYCRTRGAVKQRRWS